MKNTVKSVSDDTEKINVFNPCYVSEKLDQIDCEIEHPKYGRIPFTASRNDSESHGVEIFNLLVEGEFGDIAAYEPQPPKTKDQLAEEVRVTRDGLLRALDALVSNPLRWSSLSDAKKMAYSEYRQSLLDITKQSSFPTQINWPVLP